MKNFKERYNEYVTTDLYLKSKKNAAEAERIFNGMKFMENSHHITITRQTILRWWKDEELETRPPSRGYTHGVPEKIFRIVHKKAKGDLNEMKKYLNRYGTKKSTIKGRCRQHGLKYY